MSDNILKDSVYTLTKKKWALTEIYEILENFTVISVQDIVNYWKEGVKLPEEVVPSQLSDISIQLSSSQTSITCSLGSSESSNSSNSSFQEGLTIDSPRPSNLSTPSHEPVSPVESAFPLKSSSQDSSTSKSNTLQATANAFKIDTDGDGTDEDADNEIVTEPKPYKLPNAANIKVSRAMELVNTGMVKYDEDKKIFLVFDTVWRIVSLFPEKCGCIDSPNCCYILRMALR